MTRQRAAIFCLLYCCVVLYLSLYPGEFELHPRAQRLGWVPLTGRRQILDAVLNVLFYVPLGASALWAAGRKKWLGWLLGIGTGALLSGVVEWLQLWTPRRFGNWNDFAANTTGAVLGVALAQTVRSVARAHFPESRRRQMGLSPTQGLFLGLWLLWHMFPFIPAIRLDRLTRLPEYLAPWSWQVAVEVGLGFAALRTIAGGSWWLGVALAALPAQAFLSDRNLSPAALCGALAGWAAAESPGPRFQRALRWLLTGWLIVEELRPFQFSTTPGPFGWAPFHSWYDGSGYPVYFAKLYLYAAAIWAWRRDERPWWIAAGAPMAILAAGEWVQRYIPGRTPESTDVVLALGGAILCALCETSQRGEFAVQREQNQV